MLHIPMAALLAALPLIAVAQTAPPRPNPLDANVTVPALTYRSALADYRRTAADPAPLGWRDANDQVERIGGWRAYAREAHAPEPSASRPAAPAAPAASPVSPQPRPALPATGGHRH